MALARTIETQRAAPQIEPPSNNARVLPDGWRRSFPIGVAQLGDGHTYHVWVEDGWLHVCRKTASQQPDWHIVLARVVNGEQPEITRRDDSTFFSLSYRKGRYFVREDINNLLCVRERKTSEDGTLSPSRFVSDSAVSLGSCGSAKSTPVLRGWDMDSWFVVAGGPTDDGVDVFLRLNSADSGGFGFQAMRDSPIRRSFKGRACVLDDGEFLHADRVLEPEVAAQIRRSRLVGSAAPELVGRNWLNTNSEIDWEDLKGKVVLLDFWATWCVPCVKKIPEVEKLYENYKDKGFLVFGIHDVQGSDSAAQFVESRGIRFAILLDDGTTGKSYAVSSLPSYVLVDKTGHVVLGPSNTPPNATDIERLLDR